MSQILYLSYYDLYYHPISLRWRDRLSLVKWLEVAEVAFSPGLLESTSALFPPRCGMWSGCGMTEMLTLALQAPSNEGEQWSHMLQAAT